MGQLTIGPVVRLQAQRSPLKPGVAPHRWYDPAPVQPVSSLDVDGRGATGVLPDGSTVADVHHPDHPLSRNRRGRNGISLLATADYDVLRQRFGPRLADGVAGESVLVDSDRPVAELVGRSLTVGGVDLVEVAVAPPCMEFARWCLGRHDTDVDDDVKAAFDWLDVGRRGVYAVPVGPGIVRLGDCLTAR